VRRAPPERLEPIPTRRWTIATIDHHVPKIHEAVMRMFEDWPW
jgi:hypothetical protein